MKNLFSHFKLNAFELYEDVTTWAVCAAEAAAKM
jgi:hypothetical protein